MDSKDSVAELRDISESLTRIDRNATTALLKTKICTKNMLLLKEMSYKSAKSTILVIESLKDMVKLTEPLLSKIMNQYDCCQDTMKPTQDSPQLNLKNKPAVEVKMLLTDLVKSIEELENSAVIPNNYSENEAKSHSERESMIYNRILNFRPMIQLQKLDDMYPDLNFTPK